MNITLVITLSIVIVLLVLCSGFFSACDIVYATVNQLRLKKDVSKGQKSAKLALKFAETYDTTITTILFANNLVNILASSLGAVLCLEIFNRAYYSTTVSTVSLLLLIVTFGEILPKVIGRAYSYKLSKLFAWVIYCLRIILFPFIFVCTKIGQFFARIFIKKDKNDNEISNEELEEIVEAVEEDGVIDSDQSELIKSTIAFKETEAHEIMTPRVDMYAINIEDDLRILIKDNEFFKHSRIPVYKETIDNIVGILPIKALLRKILAGEKYDIESLLVPVKFVPDAMGISELLENMKESKVHVAIVVDEFGGTDGIITMEDILEELVGEMYDEMDKVNTMYKKVKRNQYVINGDMNINDFFEMFNIDKPDNCDYTSVGGWVIDKLERFAKVGDEFAYNKLRVEVTKVDKFTVEEVNIRVARKIIND